MSTAAALAAQKAKYEKLRSAGRAARYGGGILWTEQDDARITELRAQGYSSGLIAQMLGRSRNSIIGRWKRLGLCSPKVRTRDGEADFYSVPKRRVARGKLAVRPSPVFVLVPKIKCKPVPVTIPCENPVLFLERKAGQCAWPLWGEGTPLEAKTCCGSPCAVTGAQTCPAHAAVAYGHGTESERRAAKFSRRDAA